MLLELSLVGSFGLRTRGQNHDTGSSELRRSVTACFNERLFLAGQGSADAVRVGALQGPGRAQPLRCLEAAGRFLLEHRAGSLSATQGFPVPLARRRRLRPRTDCCQIHCSAQHRAARCALVNTNPRNELDDVAALRFAV